MTIKSDFVAGGSADRLLQNAIIRDCLQTVVILGIDEDGNRYFSANTRDEELISSLVEGLNMARNMEGANQ